MAVYKVPQDVEADDKLIGPFSFRQFVYLGIVAALIALAWWLAQLFIGLLLIPLPFIVFFGALALPLRKDQPMEVFLAAMVSFYLKPRKRLWDADGIDSLIEITVPKSIDMQLTKTFSGGEAEERLGYLAQIVDSQGWAVRGQGAQAPNSAMNSDIYFEAQQVVDVLDSSASVAQSLDHMIDQSDAKRHREMIDRLHQPAAPAPAATTTAPNPYDFFSSTPPATASEPAVVNQSAPVAAEPPAVNQPTYNPYPTDIQQSVIQPLESSGRVDAPTTSEKPVSPDIINLANNADLSIETIAREANRIHKQQDMSEEVVISLR